MFGTVALCSSLSSPSVRRCLRPWFIVVFAFDRRCLGPHMLVFHGSLLMVADTLLLCNIIKQDSRV